MNLKSLVNQRKKQVFNKGEKPFLRWAGGKSKFVNLIVGSFPSPSEIGTYYEPFLGAASSFLCYCPPRAKLSDLNEQLINTFHAIRENPKLIYRYLREFEKKDSEAFYYDVREQYNRRGQSFIQAARFIYLNKTCFNGIFRVNMEGAFNVPYGHKDNINIPSLTHLLSVSKLLQNVKLTSEDYKDAISGATTGDFVYLDPPYPPINGSSYFTHYTKERFSEEDQHEVAEVANELSKKGCRVLISNADKESIRTLYKGWWIYSLMRTRSITSSKHKHKVGELIIANYDLE